MLLWALSFIAIIAMSAKIGRQDRDKSWPGRLLILLLIWVSVEQRVMAKCPREALKLELFQSLPLFLYVTYGWAKVLVAFHVLF